MPTVSRVAESVVQPLEKARRFIAGGEYAFAASHDAASQFPCIEIFLLFPIPTDRVFKLVLFLPHDKPAFLARLLFL